MYVSDMIGRLKPHDRILHELHARYGRTVSAMELAVAIV